MRAPFLRGGGNPAVYPLQSRLPLEVMKKPKYSKVTAGLERLFVRS